MSFVGVCIFFSVIVPMTMLDETTTSGKVKHCPIRIGFPNRIRTLPCPNFDAGGEMLTSFPP